MRTGSPLGCWTPEKHPAGVVRHAVQSRKSGFGSSSVSTAIRVRRCPSLLPDTACARMIALFMLTDRTTRRELASGLHMTEAQVQTWFHNHRAKARQPSSSRLEPGMLGAGPPAPCPIESGSAAALQLQQLPLLPPSPPPPPQPQPQHIHEFLPENESYNEATDMWTQRCVCGFLREFERI